MMIVIRSLGFAFVLFCSISSLLHILVEAEFDPYQLNGGLITAVAGRNFVVIATDTRLIGSTGYDILERSHISSRLWSATPTGGSSSTIIAPDGSIRIIPTYNSYDEHNDNSKSNNNLHPKLFAISSSSRTDNNKQSIIHTEALKHISSWRTSNQRQNNNNLPVIVGSAGCNVDCEVLKRTVRSEVRNAYYFGEISSSRPIQIVTLLSQILYSRRGFPYYSFCVVAGISGIAGIGEVYVFDAIGSYEQVAVACTGTGRELLQPILDRQFRSLLVDDHDDNGSDIITGKSKWMISKRSTIVDCTSIEEVISALIDSYRAVSEREIGVGDQIVFYTMERKLRTGTTDNEMIECNVYTAPLKKH